MIDLSQSERAAVEATVAAAERRTAAQFALVVAHASDDYATYPMLWSAVIALVVGDIVALVRPDLGTWWIVAVQAALFVVADLVLHRRPLRYRLVPARVRKAHATRLARLEFAARVQDRSAGDVGLLLFVSAAERHVEILVDRGIAARIDQKLWERIVADFVAGVAAGKIAAALTGAVEACTAILEQYFPPRPGETSTISGTITEV